MLRRLQRRLRVALAILALALSVVLAGMSVAAAEPLDLADGTYEADVTLTGGTGRASVASPTTLVASGGSYLLSVTWSSPHYDYMVVDGERILPTATDPTSVFEIPVTVAQEPIALVADTTAMSEPHEIAYELTIEATRATSAQAGFPVNVVAAVPVLVAVAITVLYTRRRQAL